jgi:DNA-binding FadR family transcriptional regulator
MTATPTGTPNLQLRQPRVAELVADELRNRILSGSLADGDMLSNQDKLLEEFRVSKPSLREALRILEAEGLITVRRGNIGGAVVHIPQAEHAAYTLALVLQSRSVPIGDVVAAVKQLDSVCAALCADRGDRAQAVVPVLDRCNEASRAALDDGLVFVQTMADFHNSIISCSGNETLSLVAGALESLWRAHLRRWAETVAETGELPERPSRERALQAHERITNLIKLGDAASVVELTRDHFDPWQYYGEPTQTIKASPLRDIAR